MLIQSQHGADPDAEGADPDALKALTQRQRSDPSELLKELAEPARPSGAGRRKEPGPLGHGDMTAVVNAVTLRPTRTAAERLSAPVGARIGQA